MLTYFKSLSKAIDLYSRKVIGYEIFFTYPKKHLFWTAPGKIDVEINYEKHNTSSQTLFGYKTNRDLDFKRHQIENELQSILCNDPNQLSLKLK